MPIYYMFLAFLLLVVLLSWSFKEGLQAQDKAGDMYRNYDIVEKGFEAYAEKFKSLDM